ncbi:MAG TPA: head GIN domain-containing protein [Cyclobacteriaceae bacterium]|nr:head GIN domain-containing protein [Cyclobacteriaceae bacterium]
MKILRFSVFAALISLSVSSCLREQDPGPLQSDERNYNLQDFDRLEMGDAFVVTVVQSSAFSITIRGDRRNLDALNVSKLGTTLRIAYPNNAERDHETFITIGMPALRGAAFSGASSSTISGFKGDAIDLVLTGASISQVSIESKRADINLSGASHLTVTGKGEVMNAKISGASELYAYNFAAGMVDADASGASKINVFATQTLKATASGASLIYYKGSPSVTSSASGASTVAPDN